MRRYPGVVPYEFKHKDVFKGRDTDIRNLLNKIAINRTIVVHAPSGTGKTSLINAAIFPELSKSNSRVIPINIRFEGLKKTTGEITKVNEAENALVQQIINEIKREIKKFNIVHPPFLLKNENDLWYWAKLLEIIGKDLVIIFDQFENIESYNYEQIDFFKDQLVQIFSRSLSTEYYDFFLNRFPNLGNLRDLPLDDNQLMQYNEESSILKKSLNSKAIFVIREDKLGVLSDFADSFPDILKNDFSLKQFIRQNAIRAIDCPAFLIGEFDSPPFKFTTGAINYILEKLELKTTGLYDPFEIQIVCSYVENKLIEDLTPKDELNPIKFNLNKDGQIEIDEKYLPQITDIIESFYQQCWKDAQVNIKILNTTKFEACRKEIISELVINNKRVQVFQELFSENAVLVLNELKKCGLVRTTIVGSDTYYRLCHDRFIEPINENIKKYQDFDELERSLKLYSKILSRLKFEFNKNEAEINTLRDFVETKMIVENKRTRVNFNDIPRYNIAIGTVEILIEEKFLSPVIIEDIKYIEIADDRLLEPILNAYQVRIAEDERNEAEKERLNLEVKLKEAENQRILKEKEIKAERLQIELEKQGLEAENLKKLKDIEAAKATANRKRFVALSWASLALILSLIFAIYSSLQAKRFQLIAEQKRLQADSNKMIAIRNLESAKKNLVLATENIFLSTAKSIKSSNPTLSFLIAQEWMNKNTYSNDFKSFINQFDADSSKYAYLVGYYPVLSKTIAAEVDEDKNKLSVTEYDGNTLWDMKEGLITATQQVNNGEILKRIKIKNEWYLAVANNKSIEFRNIKGNTIQTFPDNGEDGRNLTASPNGRFVLIANTIYNFNTGKKIGGLPHYSINKDQMCSVFLNDNKHLAVGYWSGYKFIYNINEEAKEDSLKVFPVAIYKDVDGFNSVITSLAIDKNNEYLVAGNRAKHVEIWKINSLIDRRRPVDSLVTDMDNNQTYTLLTGHSGYVNQVIISPDNQYVLSASDDHTAIISNLKTGKKLMILKGSDANVIYGGFSNNGKMILTATADKIYLWKMGKASELYKNNELIKFCPLDYYSIGFQDKDAKHLFGNNQDIRNQFSNTLLYLTDLPQQNQSPEDMEYLNSLKKSIKEVDSMYQNLIKDYRFKKEISIANKKILYTAYNNFLLSKPELLLQSSNTTLNDSYNKVAKADILGIKVLLLDTSDVPKALQYAKEIGSLGVYYRKNKQYQNAINYLTISRNLLSAFDKKKKHSDIEINRELNTTQSDLVISYAYAGNFNTAIKQATVLQKMKAGIGLANLRFVQIYLLAHQYDKAMNIFITNENVPVLEDSKDPLKDYLLKQLKYIKNIGKNTPEVDKFIAFLENRK